jgi:hypothetical protein
MTNMTGSKLSIFSHPGKITGYWITTRSFPNILFINDIFYVELSLKTYQLNFQIYVFSRYLYNYIYIN